MKDAEGWAAGPMNWRGTMALKAAQKSQLLSAYAMIGQYRREIEDLAKLGRPPAGSSARLRPLPTAEAEALLEPLAELQARLREAIRSLTADDPDADQRTQSLHATRIWAANIFDRIRDTLTSLGPDRLAARYGGLSKADAETLGELGDSLEGLLDEARAALGRRKR
ncbi:MAG: hypothetical protein PVH68_18275 [Armatimonadota bacterium]|jgi:hypothetical protein